MSASQDNSITLPINLDNPFSKENLYFFGCLGVALFVVVLFGRGKFGESTVAPNKDDFISQLLPRYLATPEEYFRAQVFYLASLSVIVSVFSLLGPRVLGIKQ